MKEKIISKIYDWSRRKQAKPEEIEFEEFIQEHKERLTKISEIYHPRDNDELKQLSIQFYNSYNQRKMVESTDSLNTATWVLAISTISFTVAQIWGSQTASRIVQEILKVTSIIVLVILIIVVFKLIILESIKKIFTFIIAKQKHIYCGQCGRIIYEYEKEGDNKPAITTCPKCNNKIHKK